MDPTLIDAASADAEARHRIANAFQLMSTLARMRLQRAKDAETRRHLSALLESIGALGVLQQRLSRGAVEFAGYLEEMLPGWRRRCADRPIELSLQAEPATVRGQAASALALIASELVSNALAHGFPDGRSGTVRIVLRGLAGDRAALSVADDGVGFDPAAPAGPDRLGLWLIRGLADQLKGQLSTSCTAGCETRLVFPVEAET